MISPMAGTIFEHSSTPLRLWFYAMYLMGSTRCGISAKQIERETGVTYKTAWRMFKQIRSMLEEDSPIGGKGRSVEMDEAYSADGVRAEAVADCAVTVASNTRPWYSGSQNGRAASLRKQ